jgi:predicted DNA-binding transcriptional regulator AlpA
MVKTELLDTTCLTTEPMSPRPPRRARPLPDARRDYIGKRELRAIVPLSMTSIDRLEKKGAFPSRFVLSPTIKGAWKRREIEKWLAHRANKRVHNVNAENEN